MIFVTVGEQLPFDRLIRTIDEWASSSGRSDVFAQIGDGSYLPRHVAWERFLAPDDFKKRLLAAQVIVAHAGMGSILTALECGKPVLVLPRRAALHEQRNDHQLATVRRLSERGLVQVAMDEEQLRHRLEEIDVLAAVPTIGSRASTELLAAIQEFVNR